MHTADRRLFLLRRMAWSTLLLLLAVTALSAFLRQRAAGLGCASWPVCFGQGDSAATGALQVAGQALTLARAAHRVTATLALLLIVAMVWLSLAQRPRQTREGALALALLLLALMLAGLGLVTPGSRVPAVAIGNLLGGFAMLALAARLAAPSSRVGLGGWAIGALALLLLQAASGAFVSAAMAGLACTDLRECAEQARAAGWDGAALDPWRVPGFAVGGAPSDGALVQLVHRLGAFVVVPALAGLALLALRRGRQREAWALLALLASVWVLGMLAGSSGLPLAPVLLHNLATALLWALVLRLA